MPASHFFEGFYSEDSQAGLKDEFGAGAKHETETALGGVAYHHLVLVVEGTESGGQFEKIGAQEMRLQLLYGLLQGEREKDQLPGKGSFVFGLGRTGIFLK